MQRFLVVGATGDQGYRQASALAAAGHTVLGAGRQPDPARLPNAVKPVALDLLAPATLPAVLGQVDTVFLNLPSASFNDPGEILQGFQNFLHAAEQSAIRRIVFNASLYVGDRPVGHVAHDVRHGIIQDLLASPVPATAVCPVIFMENMLRGWALPALRERQVLSYPHGEDLPVSWVSLDDVARIMIALADDPEAIDRRYVIGGPEALRGAETAAALSRAWGREIRFESLPVEDFARRMGGLFGGGDRAAEDRIATDLHAIYSWYNTQRPSPFTVDMSQFRQRHALPLLRVDDWARLHPIFPPITPEVNR
ncbi:MAG: NmrA family NAD(P)-binding protein [Haliea sp.]|uniref:SDR family oxidoreductase n=1 Tax=Haliea sp. TaxID=1932666 RepID=UPI0032EEDB9F